MVRDLFFDPICKCEGTMISDENYESETNEIGQKGKVSKEEKEEENFDCDKLSNSVQINFFANKNIA